MSRDVDENSSYLKMKEKNSGNHFNLIKNLEYVLLRGATDEGVIDGTHD